MVDVRNLCAHGIKTRFHGERGKAAEVFSAVETLFSDGEGNFAIDDDRRGGVRVKHIEAQD
jgi:hypothetical protein